MQMQFKKAVEDHRGGHSVSARERRKRAGESKGYLYRKKAGERKEGGNW